jgi:predicted CXXCH cytochrome family protein
MKNVILRSFSLYMLLAVLMVSLVSPQFASAQEGDPVAGKQLFNSNCAACHRVNQKLVGPALVGVTQKRTKEWLQKWIRNSSDLINSGDAQAKAIFEEFNKVPMTPFPLLTDAEIDNILAYVEAPPPAPVVDTAVASTTTAPSDGGQNINQFVVAALIIVLLLLVVMLVLVRQILSKIAKANGIEITSTGRKPIWKAFAENQFLVLVTVIFLLLGSAYFAYGYLMQVGVDQGYQPIQPIHYSHKIHAGVNQIDCNYCHSSARTSKTSGIPSLNVCMNCHKSISEYKGETTAEYSKAFYDGEIQKLYKAVGWDAEVQQYSGETQPVEWVRVHNLPDFAYFNHSQHVTVGGVACQTCHGPVQEMEIMSQFSPLTMGWCINCHRQTEVKMDNNPYYEKIHEELSKKYGLEKPTVAEMGGLECAKCHY